MDTPRTRAGALTEAIMARAGQNLRSRKEPPLSAASYNAIYEAVYQSLAWAENDVATTARFRAVVPTEQDR